VFKLIVGGFHLFVHEALLEVAHLFGRCLTLYKVSDGFILAILTVIHYYIIELC